MSKSYEVSDQEYMRLNRVFTYHKPFGDQPQRYERIRNAARGMAGILTACCPASRELSLALTHLEQVAFFANAAIARNETPPPETETPQPAA